MIHGDTEDKCTQRKEHMGTSAGGISVTKPADTLTLGSQSLKRENIMLFKPPGLYYFVMTV